MDESQIEDSPKESPEQAADDGDIEVASKSDINIESLLAGIPIPTNTIVINDWQEHFKNFQFNKKIVSAYQNISNVKSNSLVSGNTAHIDPNENMNIEDLNVHQISQKTFDRNDIIKTILSDIEEEPHRILMATYKSETAKEISTLTDALLWIMEYHFGISKIGDISLASDDTLREMLF